MTQYTPMIQQYLQVKADFPDAFLFFRLGDFYELFFEDALQASKVLEITLTGRAGGGDEKIPMCGVPYHSAEQYISRLIHAGYKVAICEQVEDAQQAKGIVKREVVKVITPGTIMDQSMLQERENNYILFVTKGAAGYALLGCDTSTGEISGTVMNQLQELMNEGLSYQAAEMIASDQFSQDEQTVMRRYFGSRLLFQPLDEDCLNMRWKTKILDYLQQKEIGPELETALTLLYEYLHNTQKGSLNHLQPFHYYQSHQFLKLDPHSQRNLELVETIRDRSKKGSLLWLIDETRTAMGGRLLKKWIQRPLVKRQPIEERLEAVEQLIRQSFQRTELEELLDQVYDLERLAGRVSYGNVNPRDFLQLKKSLQVIPTILELLASFSTPVFQQLIASVDPCTSLAERLEQAIVEEPPLSIKEGGIFRQGFHPELDKLLEASVNGKKWIADLEAKERLETGIKSLKVGYNKVFGYYIEVTRANLALLEEGRYERKQTLANAERFITPELKEMESLILEASEKKMEVEYQLFLQLREEALAYIDTLQRLAHMIARLDVYCSFARVSETYHYTRPTFNEEGLLAISNGRHPVIEKVLTAGSFVDNDVYMDREKEILLITGPNMAGKSTYMRKTAIIVILAQMGCFVPAEKASLPLFDQIFTRIGAADDLVGGQSTFMVEMMETKQAITQATPDSLILLDEIGRGTSTYDGMSLAQAVVEFIHDQVGAKTMFSTHYHELTQLEEKLSKVKNIHVACSEQEGRVIFLHKVREGKADRSYGIHVAQIADMPESVIQRAHQILGQLEAGVALDQEEDQEKRPQSEQIQFFFDETEQESLELIHELGQLSINELTPIEALNLLHRYQQRSQQIQIQIKSKGR